MKKAMGTVFFVAFVLALSDIGCAVNFLRAQEPVLVELGDGTLVPITGSPGIFSVNNYITFIVDKKSVRYENLKRFAKGKPKVRLMLQVPAADEYPVIQGEEIAIVGLFEKTTSRDPRRRERDYNYRIGEFLMVGFQSHLERKLPTYQFDTARLIIRKIPD